MNYEQAAARLGRSNGPLQLLRPNDYLRRDRETGIIELQCYLKPLIVWKPVNGVTIYRAEWGRYDEYLDAFNRYGPAPIEKVTGGRWVVTWKERKWHFFDGMQIDDLGVRHGSAYVPRTQRVDYNFTGYNNTASNNTYTLNYSPRQVRFTALDANNEPRDTRADTVYNRLVDAMTRPITETEDVRPF